MERLTYWNCKEKGSALPVSINGDGDVVGLETLCAKLAAYEDTELEPDLVQHLAELYSNPSPNWLADRQELATYRALGPIAHLRELVEVDTPTPVVVRTEADREYIDYICPKCGDIIDQKSKGQKLGLYRPKHHADCGQRLDWSRAEAETAQGGVKTDERL